MSIALLLIILASTPSTQPPGELTRLEAGELVRIAPELAIRRLAPATYLVVHDQPFGNNSVVAELPDGTLLLVGSPNEPTTTRVLLGWLRTHFTAKALLAIDTHFHFDAGPGGHEAYAEAGATIYSADLTAELLRDRGEAQRQALLGWAAGKPESLERIRAMKIVAATKLFPLERGLALRFGDEVVQVRFPGRAHAPDNVYVWFPSRRVLVAGCAAIAMPRLGNLADADVASWPGAVEAMKKLGATIVVPGHGPVGDAALLDHTLELLRAPPSKT